MQVLESLNAKPKVRSSSLELGLQIEFTFENEKLF